MGLSDIGDKVIWAMVVLAVFFTLVSQMPIEFIQAGYSGQTSYDELQYDTYYDETGLENIRYFLKYNVTRSAIGLQIWDFDDASPSINFKIRMHWHALSNEITFSHVIWEPIEDIIFQWEAMYVGAKPNEENTLWKDYALLHLDNDTYVSHIYPVWDGGKVNVWLSDYNSTRNNLATAWDEGTIQMAIGFGFDDMELGMQGWDLIAGILMFQAPDIHPVLNLFIAFPLWALIAFIYAVVIFEVVQALPFT